MVCSFSHLLEDFWAVYSFGFLYLWVISETFTIILLWMLQCPTEKCFRQKLGSASDVCSAVIKI